MDDSLNSTNINYSKISRCVSEYSDSNDLSGECGVNRIADHHYVHRKTTEDNDRNSMENLAHCKQETSVYSQISDGYGSLTETISMDVIVYETNQNNNNNTDDKEYYCTKVSRSNSFDYDYNNHCEHKIRTLTADNRKLNEQLNQSEEQIIDLISDKQSLSASLNQQNQAFVVKIAAKNDEIDELTQNLVYFEKVNEKLEKQLKAKSVENAKLALKIEEMEDKLSESQKTESQILNACNHAKQALSVAEGDKHETIHQLHNAFVQCAQQETQIVALKQQIDILNQIISDQDSECWFARNHEKSAENEDIGELSSHSSANSVSSDHCDVNHNLSTPIESKKMPEISDSISNEFQSCCESTETSSIGDRKDHNTNNGSGDHITGKSLTTDCGDQSTVFPSLPDVILRNHQLLRENCCNPETLTEEEIESKFATLALAFRTDRFTLEKRIEVQKRQRDVAELNANNELLILRNSIRKLTQLVLSSDDILSVNVRSDAKELINKIETNIDVVAKTNAKIASRAELYGAVRQEEKFSTAFDVILLHAENLKRLRDKERRELEEAKHFINIYNKKTDLHCNNGKIGNNGNGDSDSDYETSSSRRTVRSYSSTVPPQANLIRVRRASVSSIEVLRNTESNGRRTTPNGNANINLRYVTSNVIKSNRSRRRSMPASAMQLMQKNINDSGDNNMSSHLEITAEEKGECDSDCSESLTTTIPEHTEQISHTHNQIVEQQTETVANQLSDALMPDMTVNQANDASVEDENIAISRDSDQSNATAIVEHNNNHISNTLKLFEFHYITDMYNYCVDGGIGLNNCFKRLIVSINGQQIRLVFAVLLLILAAIIVIMSFIPNSVPPYRSSCWSWEQIITTIFSPILSKEIVSKTQ